MRRSRLPVPLLVAALLGGSMARTDAQETAEAGHLLAAFVARFPQFVEWPGAVLEGRTALDVCVVEPDPFADVLDELLAGEQSSGRSLRARRVNHPSQVAACHVLYVPRSAPAARSFLAATTGRPVLTVGESPGFLDQGGMLDLVIVDRRVRFRVNQAAAANAGLRLSSQLLALALEVRRAP